LLATFEPLTDVVFSPDDAERVRRVRDDLLGESCP
jgi:hypothetical protein